MGYFSLMVCCGLRFWGLFFLSYYGLEEWTLLASRHLKTSFGRGLPLAQRLWAKLSG